MAATVADVMVATLKASGLQRVYGLPGDSLYATRTILSGGGGELIDLARTNLRELEAE
jgi:pyruvate dehydrogenase (quinone)